MKENLHDIYQSSESSSRLLEKFSAHSTFTLEIIEWQLCALDRVVGASNFQTAELDALFVVFLGIKWAHDFAKKSASD